MIKRFGAQKLTEDTPFAFRGETGYQADLLMPGWWWAFWILCAVEKHPWVQVPAGEIGVVIAPHSPEQEGGHMRDVIGVVTTLQGDPLPANDMAGRLGRFGDLRSSQAGSAGANGELTRRCHLASRKRTNVTTALDPGFVGLICTAMRPSRV